MKHVTYTVVDEKEMTKEELAKKVKELFDEVVAAGKREPCRCPIKDLTSTGHRPGCSKL